jgi:tetratricopeptide (TPR) repeat protein
MRVLRLNLGCIVVVLYLLGIGTPLGATEAQTSGERELDKAHFKESLKWFDETIRGNPKDKRALRCRGFAHLLSGDPERAIRDFTAAIEVDAQDPVSFYGRACAERFLGRTREAIADLTKAIRLDPQYGAAYNERAAVYEDSGIPLAGSDDVRRATEITLSEPETPSNAPGNVYLGRGAELAIGRRVSLTGLAYDCWSLIFGEYRAYASAVGERAKTVDQNPRDAIAHKNIALVQIKQGELDKGMGSLGEALRLAPSDCSLYKLRAALRAVTRDLSGAVADATRAISICPTDKESYELRISIYDEMGKYAEASADLKQLSKLRTEEMTQMFFELQVRMRELEKRLKGKEKR